MFAGVAARRHQQHRGDAVLQLRPDGRLVVVLVAEAGRKVVDGVDDDPRGKADRPVPYAAAHVTAPVGRVQSTHWRRTARSAFVSVVTAVSGSSLQPNGDSPLSVSACSSACARTRQVTCHTMVVMRSLSGS